METHTEKLYSVLTKEGFDVGDSASFVEAMKSPERRKKLYESADQNGFDLGDPAEFDAKIASDFQPAPAPTPDAPVDQDAKRVRELLSSGSWSPKSLDPASIGGPVLSAAPVPSENQGRKEAASANREIEALYNAAIARGEKYLSVEDFVKRKLDGKKFSPGVTEDLGANLAGISSKVRRSSKWAPIETGAKLVLNGLLTPERMIPGAGESITSNAEDLRAASLFQNLKAQEGEVQTEAQKAAINKVNSDIAATGVSPGADATATMASRQAPEPGVMESLGNLGSQIAADPRGMTAELLGSMVTPENVAAEALTGNVATGLLKGAANATSAGRRVSRLLSNPLVDAGLTKGSGGLVKGIGREVAQGTLAEYLGTGDVTKQGVVENLIPAAVGTPIMHKLEGAMTRRPKTAIAPGGETINAAPRTGTMDPPASAQEPAAPPAAPEPVQPVDQPAQPAVAPEPVAPAAAPVPDAPEVPAEGMTSAVRKSKMSPDMKKAARIAKTENKQARSDAKAIRDDNLKMAEALAKRGQFDAAKDIVTKTRDLFEETTPGLADGMVTSYHKYFDDMKADIDAKAAAKKAKKPRASKMDKPKSKAQAEVALQEAVATGTPEAIDAALPAAQVLAPVGDEAAKIIEDAKAQLPPEPEAAVPTTTEPVTPVKPTETVTDLTETEKAAQKERPVISNGKTEIDHPSQEDWKVTPVVASRSAASIWGNKDNLAALRAVDPGLAGTVARSQKKLAMRQMETVGKNFEPVMDVLAQADEALAEYGITMEDYLEERGAELNDFLKEKGIDRPTLDAAYHNVQATPTEQAHFTRAAAAMTGDSSPIQKAKGEMTVSLGAFGMMPDVPAHLQAIAAKAAEASGPVLDGLERISDELKRGQDLLASDPKWADQHAAMKSMNEMTHAFNAKVEANVAKLKAPIRHAAEMIPFEYWRKDHMEKVTDALEGEDVQLNEGQQALHDAIRTAFDADGDLLEQVTGNKKKENWVPRKEDKARVDEAIKGLHAQLGADSLTDAILSHEMMTLENAKKLPKKIDNPLAAEAIDNYFKGLQELFEIKEGKVVPVQKDGRDLIDSKSVYLKLIDENGDLDPFLPEILEKKRTPENGQLKMQVVGKNPQFQPDWTPEDLKTLLRGEAIRLLYNRHEYIPDPNSVPITKNNFAKRHGHWQADGSILYGRFMPYMGKAFYERNPITLADEIISRQQHGLKRWEMFGKDKSVILDHLVRMRGPFTDAQIGIVAKLDGTFRLAEPSHKGFYEHSMLRSYEDVMMGYIRPFSEAGKFDKQIAAAGSIARGVLLMKKLIPTLRNEIDGLGTSLAVGPEALAVWIAQRTRVAAMQQESAVRKVGARVAKLAGARGIAEDLLKNDPMTIADELAMSNLSQVLGVNPWDRYMKQADKMAGSFSASTHAMSITAHFVAQKMFEDAVFRRAKDLKKFNGDFGIIAEGLNHTMADKALTEAANLLDSEGFPRSKEAAKRLIEIARPFAGEFKSWVADSNSPLYQPKAMRQRWVRSASWLAMTPLALQSAAYSSLIRTAKKIQRSSGAEKAKLIGEFAKRGSLQQAGVMLNGTLKTMAAAHAAHAAIAMGIGVGAYGALLAGQAVYGSYDPDDRIAQAKWAATKDALSKLTKLAVDQASAGTLARTLLAGQTFIPRGIPTETLSSEESKLAGIPQGFGQKMLDVGNIAWPQVNALIQMGKQAYTLGKLAATGGADVKPLDLRSRASAGMGALQAVLPIPSPTEYMGKDIKAWKNILQKYDTGTKTDAIESQAKLLKESIAPMLMQSKIEGDVTKIMGSGHRAGTFSR